jgi:uncharacterized membrane protein YesL
MNLERSSMLLPFSIFKRALRLLWDELFLLGLAGYCWMLLSILILPLVPITAGLFYVTNQVAHGNAIKFGTQFTGARLFFGRSLIWGAINVVAGLLIWADLQYYQQLSGDLGTASLTLALLLALAWGILQIFTLPCLIENGPQQLKAAFRQAFVLVISQPLFIVTLLIVLALLALLCWYLPIMLGYAMVLLALIANVAVIAARDQSISSEVPNRPEQLAAAQPTKPANTGKQTSAGDNHLATKPGRE